MPLMMPGDYSYNLLMAAFPSLAEPAFESAEMQQYVWGRTWGCANDVGALRSVLVHRPGAELARVDPTKYIPEIGAWGDREEGWYWRGPEPPDLPRMQAQHDAMVAVLRQEGVEVVEVGSVAPGRYKACSVRDAVIAVSGGAVVCRLGARVRRGEELPATRKLAELGMPILRTIHGTGVLEGGSFAWLDARTAVVGIGTRANEEGARQLEEVLRTQGVELLRVQLPGYRQHIDGVFVMLDVDLALVNPSLIPYPLLERLQAAQDPHHRPSPRRPPVHRELPGHPPRARAHERDVRPHARPPRQGGRRGDLARVRRGVSRGRRHPLLDRAAGPRPRLIPELP